MIAINNGLVLSTDGWSESSLLIDGAVVVAIGPEPFEAPDVVDARGSLVGPGFVDIHVHLREPGQTHKEDIRSGLAAGAAGGFTGLVAMPNTDPAIDNATTVASVAEKADFVGGMEVGVAAAMTIGRAGETLTDINDLYRSGVRLFTDDGDAVLDAGVLREAMVEIADLPGAVVSQHAEDSAETVFGHAHEGLASDALDVGGLSSTAEYSIIQRDIDLVRETGARYHCQHLSTAEGVDMIARAKAEGLPVTAEVTPHHLTFAESDVLDLGTNLKMYPPIRTTSDRDRLRQGLREGVIDAVATDHAPHTKAEKAVSFVEAPRGVIGLETSAAAVWEVLGDDPSRFFEVMSVIPAEIAGMRKQGRKLEVGAPANLVVFDPQADWRPAPPFQSKAENSPYIGKELRGRVSATVYQGRKSFELSETHV